jgi:epoxyqueuosine reductase
MTPEQYQQWAPGTPLARAGFEGLKRNAAYALGAMRDVGSAEILKAMLADSHQPVVEAARWALGQLAAT